MFAVHVNNIIMISSSANENSHFKAKLHQHWEISNLGDIKYALSIGISHDHSFCSLALSQTALIDCIVEQFGQIDAHPVDTLMVNTRGFLSIQ